MIELGREAAEDFLRANGRLNLSDWLALSPEARRHMVDAGDKIRGELADMIVANTPVAAAARLMGEDPERLADRIAMEHMTDAVAERLNYDREGAVRETEDGPV